VGNERATIAGEKLGRDAAQNPLALPGVTIGPGDQQVGPQSQAIASSCEAFALLGSATFASALTP
jgi:hypothetical protein